VTARYLSNNICLFIHNFFLSWRPRPRWSRTRRCQGFEITHNDAPHSVDSSGRVISPTQRPLPVNTQHWHETDFHDSGGIRTCNSRKGAAAYPRLRPRGNWAQHAYHLRLLIYPLSSGKNNSIKYFLLKICHRISGSATAYGRQDVKTKIYAPHLWMRAFMADAWYWTCFRIMAK